MGFEPTVLSHTAFRERHLQPLGHLSARENTRAAEREGVGPPSDGPLRARAGGRPRGRLVEGQREPIG